MTDEPEAGAMAPPEPENTTMQEPEAGAPEALPKYIVIHSNPSGAYFATRLGSTSRGTAHSFLEAHHVGNKVWSVMEDSGVTGLIYDGHELAVRDLSQEP